MSLDAFFDNLVITCRAGDRAAFEQLLVHCHDRLLRQIQRGIPLDLERHFDANDILQETFRAAMQSLPQLNAGTLAEFSAWISTIARHQVDSARQRVRAQKRGGGRAPIALPLDDSATTAANLLQYLARNTKSPRSIAGDREYLALMQEALGDLDTTQREILRLRFIEQRKHIEIGQQIGRTEDAVKMLCFRAIKQLRSMLPMSSS